MPSISKRLALALAAIIALGGCNRADQPKRAEGNAAASAQGEPAKGVDRSHRGTKVPEADFVDADGEQTSLAAIADGKPLLVNLWASWCAPCVKELPTLDRLSQQSGAPVRVAAVSQDNAPQASVEAFLAKHGIANLEAYQDKEMALSGALNAQILPTSVLYDAKGREVWRYTGDLDWTSPEAAELLAEAKS